MKVSFSLPADLAAQAEKRAAEKGMTVNAYAKECLRTALLDYATRHHVHVAADTSLARRTVQPRWKQSMKESKA